MTEVDLSEWAYCGDAESEGETTMIREHWLFGLTIALSYVVIVVAIVRMVKG